MKRDKKYVNRRFNLSNYKPTIPVKFKVINVPSKYISYERGHMDFSNFKILLALLENRARRSNLVSLLLGGGR